MASEQQQCQCSDEFSWGEACIRVVVGHGDQRRDQVVGGGVGVAFDQVAEVVNELGASGNSSFHTRSTVGRAEHDCGKLVAPVLELIAVLRRYAKKFGNHDGRERECEVAHKVGFVDGCELLEQFVDDFLDPRSESGNA